jgi:hypothetical protein
MTDPLKDIKEYANSEVARPMRKAEMEKLRVLYHKQLYEIREVMVEIQSAFNVLSEPQEKLLHADPQLLEGLKQMGMLFLNEAVEQIPTIVELARSLGRIEGAYEVERQMLKAIQQMSNEEKDEVVMPEGYAPDVVCIVEGCQRLKHFGDYCKRHVPDEERPKGKV